MIQKPLQQSILYSFIDLALLDKNLMEQYPLLGSKGISWKESPKDVVAKLSSAAILFIHPDVFDKWTDILIFISERKPLAIKLIIISHSDYAVGDEHIEAVRAFFPNTIFWIQNWCGLSEKCAILPLAVNGVYKEIQEKSQRLGISFVTRYYDMSNNTMSYHPREEFYSFLDTNPQLEEYILPKSDFSVYCYNLSKCYFTTCPMGEGYDTYRFWESLMVGAIPVVKDHEYYDNLLLQYPDIPIIRLKSWDELITLLPTLTPKLHEKMFKEANIGCLEEDYWLSKIRAIKDGSE